MNFKPTLWKGIISVILLIVLFELSYNFLGQRVEYFYPGGSPTGKTAVIYVKPIYLLLSFVIALIVYIIWSLFEKKTKKK